MTYRVLLEKLSKLDSYQLDKMDVVVYASEYDEYFPVEDLLIASETDVIDTDHPYITLK